MPIILLASSAVRRGGSLLGERQNEMIAKPLTPASGEETSMADLRQALKDWRRATAKRLEQPAFCVFSDKVLDIIVAARPKSNAQLAAVKGIGATKISKFGKDVISIVARHDSCHLRLICRMCCKLPVIKIDVFQ